MTSHPPPLPRPMFVHIVTTSLLPLLSVGFLCSGVDGDCLVPFHCGHPQGL